MRVKRLHHWTQRAPDRAGAIHAFLALGAETPFRSGHRGRENGQQNVAIVCLPERVLQKREPQRHLSERRLELSKTLQRVAQALTGDSEIVKASLIAPLQTSGEAASFAQPHAQDSAGQLAHAAHARQLDAFGLHPELRIEAHASKRFARSLRRRRLFDLQFLEQRPREFGFAGIEAGFEQPKDDRGIACRVGSGGGLLHPPQKALARREIGYVLEQRTKSPSRRANVVQMLLIRFDNEAPARPLQSPALVV